MRHSTLEDRLLQLLAMPFEPDAPERVVDWAVDAIVQGWDSESLRMLAGLSPVHDREEISGLLTAALRELGRAPVGDLWAQYASLVLDRP